MSQFLFSLEYRKRIRPLLAAQFFTVFNDSAFKMLCLLAIFHSKTAHFMQDMPFLLVLLAAVCFLPGLLLAVPAGRMADAFSKRTVILLSKMAEILLLIFGTVAFAKFSLWGVWPLIWCAVLLSVLGTFYRPAYYGILPETFRESDLSRANGDIGIVSFLALFAGVATPPILLKLADFAVSLLAVTFQAFPSLSAFFTQNQSVHFFLIGLILIFFSFIGFVYGVRINSTTAGHTVKEKFFFRGLRTLLTDQALFLSSLGDAFFLGIFSSVQILIFFLIRDLFGATNGGTAELQVLQAMPFIGVGLGCYWTGRCSPHKVEIGYIGFGSFGMALFLPLTVLCPGPLLGITESFAFHPLAALWLLAAGISAGFFIIPLRAYLQNELPDKARGSGLATANAICFSLVFLTDLLVFLLVSVPSDLSPAVPDFAVRMCRALPECSVVHVLTTVGVSAFAVVLLVGIAFPMLPIRACSLLLTRTLYKVRIRGALNIPERGAALLVANHVTFIDSMLILTCTSRRVRFLMREDFYHHWLFHFYAIRSGAIEVPTSGLHRMENMFEEIQSALKAGCVVCVFPEGEVSRNGITGSFKAGFSKMIPEGLSVPVIPVNIGMVWGSLFSYYYKKVRLRLPLSLPFPASVSIGAPLPETESNTAFRLRQAVTELGAEAESGARDEERTLHYRAAKNAHRHPFRKIYLENDGKTMNMFQILVAATIFSREIRRLVPEESRYVGMLLPNVSIAPICLLGIMMADKVPAPLNFTASAETLRKSIEKAGITMILTSRKFLTKIKMEPIPEMVFLEELAPKISIWKKLFWTVACAVLPHQQLMSFISPASHRDVFAPAVLLFSSGSTGTPKGVLLSHHNVNGDINSFIRVVNWTSQDTILGSLPLFHSFGFTTAFWIPLMQCSRVVFVPSPLDCTAVGHALEHCGVTILLATPTFIQSYIRRCKPEQFAHLRLAVVGAEKMRRDLADRFTEITQHKTTLIEGYGCTELSPIVTINVSREFSDLGRLEGKEGSIGCAMPGICVKIVDPVTREMLPPNEPGLMLVKGPNVMMGYLNDPVQTANVIRDGWYETGDIADMDEDGYVTISGRLSRFSKIAGEMVPHELLECVMNEMSGTEERIYAVGGIPDPAKGEALVVLYDQSATVTPEEMTQKLRERNIPNLWIPRTGNYHKVDKLPILGNGKLDLMKLRQMIQEIGKAS